MQQLVRVVRLSLLMAGQDGMALVARVEGDVLMGY
jgi:hypothetical protein